jgi:hypothetical protein
MARSTARRAAWRSAGTPARSALQAPATERRVPARVGRCSACKRGLLCAPKSERTPAFWRVDAHGGCCLGFIEDDLLRRPRRFSVTRHMRDGE